MQRNLDKTKVKTGPIFNKGGGDRQHLGLDALGLRPRQLRSDFLSFPLSPFPSLSLPLSRPLFHSPSFFSSMCPVQGCLLCNRSYTGLHTWCASVHPGPPIHKVYQLAPLCCCPGCRHSKWLRSQSRFICFLTFEPSRENCFSEPPQPGSSTKDLSRKLN